MMKCYEVFFVLLLRLFFLQDWVKYILQLCDWVINLLYVIDYSFVNFSDLCDLVIVSLYFINLFIFLSRGLDEKVLDLNVYGFLYLFEVV